MATGQLTTPCGIGGKLQTSLARARALAWSRTAMLGSFFGSGFVCPSWVRVGSRVTSTERTSAGLAQTGAGFIGAPAWPAAGVPEVLPPVLAFSQPASTPVAMITNPAPTAVVIRLPRFNEAAISLRRSTAAGGSFQFGRTDRLWRCRPALAVPTSLGRADQLWAVPRGSVRRQPPASPEVPA